MSRKILLIGDPHVTVSELADCEALLRLVGETADKEDVHAILFMGDQHHTHEIVHQEVLDFWRRHLPKFGRETFMLVGNHDRSHNLSLNSHTLWPYASLSKIIDAPFEICIGVLLVPWYAKEEDFRAVLKTRAKTIIGHQTFDGGKYENGFYASDGFSLAGFEGRQIISGHIHSPQEFGNVWYPGAPRWRTVADADTDRNIWVVEFDDTGQLISRKGISTKGVCKQICTMRMAEGEGPIGLETTLLQVQGPADLRIDIHGRQEWIDSIRDYPAKVVKDPSVRVSVRSFATRATRHRVSESEGLSAALRGYLEGYKCQFGTPPEILKKMVIDRVRL